MSAACTSARSTAAARAAPIAPAPQHRSTITAPGWARATACRSRNSVRRRGTNTPGATVIRRPQNSAQPMTCSSGSPAARLLTIASSSAGVPAADISSRASSSAKTQPAARRRLTTAGASMCGIGWSLAERPEHVLHDAAVPVVLGLARGVDPHHGAKLLAVGGDRNLARYVALVYLFDAADVEGLLAGEAQRGRRLPRPVLERQHAHADQVGPVDALEGLDEHGAHAEQQGALSGPVAGRARAVFLAAEHDQRGAVGDVLTGGVVDRHLLAVPGGDAALGARRELVAQPDVGERAADHDLVVAAAGAVGVEVLALDAVLGQVRPGRAVGLDRPGRR